MKQIIAKVVNHATKTATTRRKYRQFADTQRRANRQARRLANIAQNKSAQNLKRIDSMKQQALANTASRTLRSISSNLTDMGSNISANKTNAALAQYNKIITGNSEESTIQNPGNNSTNSNGIGIEGRG